MEKKVKCPSCGYEEQYDSRMRSGPFRWDGSCQYICRRCEEEFRAEIKTHDEIQDKPKYNPYTGIFDSKTEKERMEFVINVLGENKIQGERIWI